MVYEFFVEAICAVLHEKHEFREENFSRLSNRCKAILW
jgi:hypothetical protein